VHIRSNLGAPKAPVEHPALARGSVLRAGDFIYQCLPNKKDPNSPCAPTVFALQVVAPAGSLLSKCLFGDMQSVLQQDDGLLVLARGTSPTNTTEVLWSSKRGPVDIGDYEAVYRWAVHL
jgi:hypothetical protein